MTTPWWQEYAWAFYAAAWVLWLIAGVGLYVALLRDRSRGRRRCPKCWYDMAGVPGLKCPECGREATKERRLHTTRRRWRLATLFALLAALGLASHRAPHVFRFGFFAAVPIPILNFVLSFWSRDARVAYEARKPSVINQMGVLPVLAPGSAAVPANSAWDDLLVAWHAGTLIRDPAGVSDPTPLWMASVLGINGRPAVPALVTAADHGAPDIVATLTVIGNFGSTEAWDGLEQIAIHSTHAGNRSAAYHFVKVPRGVRGDRSAFLREVVRSSPDPDIRRDAARDLAKNSKLSRSEVMQYVGSGDDLIRCGVIEGTAVHAHDSLWLRPELLRGVRSGQNLSVRQTCLHAAPAFGPLDDEWHAPLILWMSDADSATRELAVLAIPQLGSLPTSVTTAVVRLLEDDNRFVSLYAAGVVIVRNQSFSPEQNQRAWNAMARQDRAAIVHLAKDWPIAMLAELVTSNLVPLRRAAYEILIRRADNEPGRTDLLIRFLREDNDELTRAVCAGALGETRGEDPTITSALVHAGLRDPDLSVRAVALRAAESRRDADTELVTALIEALKDPSPEVVLAAANSLARLGPRAAAAHDALTAAANHPDATARDAIADAITKTRAN